MDRFFCPELTSTSQSIELSLDERHHIVNVFRKRPGDQIEITNGSGRVAIAEVEKIDRQSVACRVLKITEVSPPLPRIHLAISTIRPKRMDWAVEKLTELGCCTIQPLIFKYTNVKAFKINHLQKIAISALKQSKQAFLPKLSALQSFSDWLQQLPATSKSLRLLAHLSESAQGMPTINLADFQDIWVIIGPEGGFSDSELALANANECRAIKLSDSILRSETAAIAAVAQAKSLCLK